MLRSNWAAYALGVVLILVGLAMIAPIDSTANGLSPLSDPESEAGVIRAGQGFAIDGFRRTAGVPNPGYNDRFPGVGIQGPTGVRADDSVYHGDPPGAYWYVGLLMTLGGTESLDRFRYVSVAINLAAMVYLTLTLVSVFGQGRALFLLLASALTSQFTSMAHGLYYHGLASALLIAEIAVLLKALTSDRTSYGQGIALVLLGFLQGLLSYHYAAVVALAVVPIALLVTPSHQPFPWKRVAYLAIITGSAFVFAHVVHFGLSYAYFGSFSETIAEYRFRSGKRYGLEGTALADAPHWKVAAHAAALVVKAYFQWNHLLAPMSVILTILWLQSLIVRQASLTLAGGYFVRLTTSVGARSILGILIAFALVEVWSILMPYHMVNHLFVIGRQLYFPFFCTGLSLAMTRIEVVRATTHDESSRPEIVQTV